MGRYDDRLFIGTSAGNKTPVEVFVGTANGNVSLGTNDSYNTQQLYIGTNSGNIRVTRDRQDYTVYNAAVQALPKRSSHIGDNDLDVTVDNFRIRAKRQATEWSTYLCCLLETIDSGSHWWAGTIYGNDNTEDWIQIEWDKVGPRWIEKMRFRTGNTTYWAACPHRLEVSFKKSDGSWTAEQTYTISSSSYTGANKWGAYFVFNKKIAQGYKGIKFRFYNNSNYKTISQSPRIGEIDLHLGTISTGTNWV